MDKNEEDIVISGMAGQFPECRNIEEFCNCLFEGKDLVTENERRFKSGNNIAVFNYFLLYNNVFADFKELPKRSGTLLDVERFDNLFFGIPHVQVNALDPRHRVILERVFECIVDAGYNPKELRGTKTGMSA